MDKNYIVTKSNNLVCSYYTLTLQEHKIILALISMVQPDDDDLKEYEFKIKDFLKLLSTKDQGKYKSVPELTKGLIQKAFTIKNTDTNRHLQISWLSSAEYNNTNGTVSLKFDSKLKPYLLMLKEYYTSYKLSNILKFKSKYSIRLYEILKRYQNLKLNISTVTIKLDELKKMIGANSKTYSLYSNFKEKCLLPAQKELKKYSDIYFDFEAIKESRRVDAVKFNILKNVVESESNLLDLDVNTEIVKDVAALDKENIKIDIEKILGEEIKPKVFQYLLDNSTLENIKSYLDNWYKFTPSKNPLGFFIKACTEKYNIPKTINNKPPQETNYEQREYDDEFFDSLYKNLEYVKDEDGKVRS